jgi:sialate O-acetylesterase
MEPVELPPLRLPALLSDHAVLQRDADVRVWGWARPGARVEVSASWRPKPVGTTAGPDGRWEVRVRTGADQDRHALAVRSDGTTVRAEDVVFGEVWLCSGQSNMEWPLGPHQGMTRVENAFNEVAGANYPRMRLFQVERDRAAAPMDDVKGRWRVCTSATAHGFSAVGYYFGRELHWRLDRPVGLIQSAWGGTAAEAWTSLDALRTVDGFESQSAPAVAPDQGPQPTHLYNAMVAPLAPYTLRGAVWYQGESNVGRGQEYLSLFPTMIADWRRAFGQPKMPFGYVQIAPFRYGDGHQAAMLREAQRRTLGVAATGMVVTTDLVPDPGDIHPPKKREVGQRLALWAMTKVYGTDIGEWSGPVAESVVRDGGAVRVRFSHASGLAPGPQPLEGFEAQAEDGTWHKAKARIEGSSVVVWLDGRPVVDARYGWSSVPPTGLVNGVGLPASPFWLAAPVGD